MTESTLAAADIAAFHDECLALSNWIATPPKQAEGVWHWLEINHRFNTQLWDEEDLARRRDVADTDIATNKRNIDGFNQKRNDAVERMDDLLLQTLASRMNPDARLHSETAGMMIDRMSILALKITAMRLQTIRTEASDEHRASCGQKLERLVDQRRDLGQCLDTLLADCIAGRARYKIYRQFKMYNDPALNPQLYGSVPR